MYLCISCAHFVLQHNTLHYCVIDSMYNPQEGLQLFIEFLEMLLTFLKEVLTGRYSLPDNSLDVILEILNKLLSLTRKLSVS